MLTDLFVQLAPIAGGWDLLVDALPAVDLLWCLECSGETPSAATAAAAATATAAAASSSASGDGGDGGHGGDGGDSGEGGGDETASDEPGPPEDGPPTPPPPPSFEDLLDKHSDSIRQWGEQERILQDARDFHDSRRPANEAAETAPTDVRPQRSDPTAGDIAEDVALDLAINTGLDIAAGKGGYGAVSGLLGTLWTVASGSATLAEGISAVASSEGRGLGGGSQSARDVAEYMPGGSSSSGTGDGSGGGE